MVILVDDEHRENEGDLVMAADFATADAINFMATHARGLICLTLTSAHCRRLQLAPMTSCNGALHRTAFTASIEAASGVTTGISAHDRARTIQAAVAPDAVPGDLVQPGHIFPLEAREGGVLVRAGHTEAGCDLAGMAGLTPASVICEVMNDDGSMARLPDLSRFAREHGIRMGTIADLIAYRCIHEPLVTRTATQSVRTAHGEFSCRTYHDRFGGVHHALSCGAWRRGDEVLVGMHEAASIPALLDATAVGEDWPLAAVLDRLHATGRGVALLLNAGAAGMATGRRASGARVDIRSQAIGAQILHDLDVGRITLLAGVERVAGMAESGIEVRGIAVKPAMSERG
ncbi:Riboflavin biosynthesis protein RibBA [Cupriavidus yeoncheonensis]|uniref:3,4-dihydroxy-2-butanone 4-phosphate synthase n=2 Tax=Cupriavidus yeoncheonensis TaxID=1462994 RepID=A0A916IY95_9BURK|nr:Riboflavin biosynthesis protein RibBA [Cupriavidus yeoncheonensis]